MNKIYIHKGDSTIFADVTKFLTFVLNTELDLTGWSATFQLANITRVIDDITSKEFEIILTSEETKSLFLGDIYGSLILKDFNGNIKTISNTIPFCVTSKVIENTSETIDLNIPDSAEINVSIKIGANTVTSINGMTGEVVLTAEDVGALPDTTIIPDVRGLATQEELAQGLETKQPKGDYALTSDLTDYVKNTDYASGTNAGVVRSGSYYGTQTIGGFLAGNPRTLEQYKEAINQIFIAKGTLENVLTQYSKTVLTTEADYNALETKDANTLYLIEE